MAQGLMRATVAKVSCVGHFLCKNNSFPFLCQMRSVNFLVFSGTYLHKASDILLNPNEWRRTKHRSQTSSRSTGLVHNTSLYDGRFTEDEWDKIPG